MHPHIINEPFPCFTVRSRWCVWRGSPGRIQQYFTPFDPQTLILVSSEKMTRSQSFSVQCWYCLAQASLALQFMAEISGFFFLNIATKPIFLRARMTVA